VKKTQNDYRSDTHSLASQVYGLLQAAAAGLAHFYIKVLYTVKLKIVKSNYNVLSYTCAYI